MARLPGIIKDYTQQSQNEQAVQYIATLVAMLEIHGDKEIFLQALRYAQGLKLSPNSRSPNAIYLMEKWRQNRMLNYTR